MARTTGKMYLVNEDGREFEYAVENINGAMTLKGPDGFFYLREDSKPAIIESLKQEIQDLKDQIKAKQAIIKEFGKGPHEKL